MARRRSPTLTDAELNVMKPLWRLRAATVREVADALDSGQALSYSTVATILRILDDKGYVSHVAEGRTFRYSPLIDEEEAASEAFDFVVSRFFRNSPKLLVMNVLRAEGLDQQELDRLDQLIQDSGGRS